MFTRVNEFVYTNREGITDYSTSIHSLSPDNARKERNNVKMQPMKVKIKEMKASWGLLRVWGTQESIPCPPLLGGPAYGHKHQRVLNSTNAANCLEPPSK